jgi:adenylate cyclase
MAPDVMAATLSEFFGAMVDCVFRHGGTLDKFIGDAVMAQWGAPEGGPDDADRAMHAAIDMQETLARLNARWRAEGARRPELSMGVGVAYGEVFAGNIGSERRLEFTVIGEAVNHASRLCDAAAGGEILVTEAVRAALREPPPLRVVPAPFAPERGATYAVVRDAA